MKKIIRNIAAMFFAIAACTVVVFADTPANDNLANAEVVTGVRVHVSRSNAGATREAGEPNHAANPGGKSIWFRWVAPKSGAFTFSTNRTESSIDTIVHVYAGSNYSTLATVGFNNNVSSPVNMKSVVHLIVSAGQTYSIALDGATEPGGQAPEGMMTLDIRPLHAYQSADYDGDSRADLALFRPSNQMWYIKGSTKTLYQKWGLQTDVPLVMSRATGRIDPAVFRPSEGAFYYAATNLIYVRWGMAGDIPVPESYGGAVFSQYAVYRPSTGQWYLRYTDEIAQIYTFGLNGDIPVPGKYSSDAFADLAVFRPSNGTWYIRHRVSMNEAEDTVQVVQFGQPGDKPVPGDYDGDGLLDPAIYRPSTGTWWVLRSSDNQQHAIRWGIASDIPVTGDFDEDGIFDFAVFRPSEGNWYIRHSDTAFGIRIEKWGLPGDIPVTSNVRN